MKYRDLIQFEPLIEIIQLRTADKKEKASKLIDTLEQNFLKDGEGRWFAPDPENVTHLERLREQVLLREFAEYTAGKGCIHVFRAEVVRAGFSKAWAERRYADIIQVPERLPADALQDDQKLKLYYDNALLRAPNEPKQERLV